jgi:hypothetical protein
VGRKATGPNGESRVAEVETEMKDRIVPWLYKVGNPVFFYLRDYRSILESKWQTIRRDLLRLLRPPVKFRQGRASIGNSSRKYVDKYKPITLSNKSTQLMQK